MHVDDYMVIYFKLDYVTCINKTTLVRDVVLGLHAFSIVFFIFRGWYAFEMFSIARLPIILSFLFVINFIITNSQAHKVHIRKMHVPKDPHSIKSTVFPEASVYLHLTLLSIRKLNLFLNWKNYRAAH